MSLLRMMRPFGLAFSFLLALTSAGSAAPATQLTGVRIDSQPNGGTAVVLQFNGSLPQITPLGIGSATITLVVAGVTPGPLVAPFMPGTGPIQSVATSQSGPSTSIFIRLNLPAAVRLRSLSQVAILDVPPANPGALLNPVPPATSSSSSAGPAPGTITVLVPLKYADISEIAGVLVQGSNVPSNDSFSPIQTNIGTNQLNGSFGGVSGGFTTGSSSQSFASGGLGNGSNGLAQRLNDNIAVDRRLNAIVLTGTPEVIEAYKSTIDKLDVPLPSVILETEIVELDATAAQNIGIDFSPGSNGIVVNGSPSTSSSSEVSTTPNGLVIKSGSTPQGAVTLAANLYAQVTKGNGKVIAKPRILAQSGQQASILTGDAIPIITSVVLTGASAVTSQQVSYINVGVDLQILPRVSSDGYVTSHIYSEVSSVTQYVQGIPQISQRTASTSATVKDGESFVIGGLLEDDEIKNLNKVPFIGDLPLIGVFFRYLSTSHTQSNLYIVVTPHIVGNYAHPPLAQPYVPVPVVPIASPPSGNPAPSPAP